MKLSFSSRSLPGTRWVTDSNKIRTLPSDFVMSCGVSGFSIVRCYSNSACVVPNIRILRTMRQGLANNLHPPLANWWTSWWKAGGLYISWEN
jgi:hypothetical protein